MGIKSARALLAAGLVGTAGVVALAPAPAYAAGGTVLFDAGGLLIGVDPGGDEIAVVDVGTSVRVSGDKGMTLTTGAPCSQVNAFVVQCPKAEVDFYEVDGSSAADTVFANGTTVNGEFYLGGGNDYLQVGRGQDFIHGEGGYDRISYNARTAPVSVSLNNLNDDGQAGEEDYVFNDVEAVHGGSGDDVFTANAGANEFRGGPGNDRFYGAVGAADLFEGHLGFDSVEYDVPASVPLDISLDGVANDGPIGQGDRILTMEMAIGGAGDDVIAGSLSPDWLVGGGGKDSLLGLAGGDVLFAEGNGSTMDGGDGWDELRAYKGSLKQLIGGDGTDTVTYAGYVEWDFSTEDYATQPVNVSINGTANDGYPGQKDKVHTDVENVAGTHGFGDTLTGNGQANELYGFGGNDTLNGSGGDDILLPQQVFGPATDKDVLSGGTGKDVASYAGETADVAVSINNTADDGPAGDLDMVKSNVEGIQGGSGDDTLTGRGSANTILGGPGDDDLSGLGGNDVLNGEGGADAISGGTGSDTASYAERVAGVTVTLNGTADDGAVGEHDHVAADVENINGGAGDDFLVGSPAVNRIYGGSGDDTLQGLGGNDLLDMGDGHDTVDAGGIKDGADKIIGWNGMDTVDYGDRFAAVKVVLNESGGDGEAGENDTVKSDVEHVVGGSGNDTITGSLYANTLTGGEGADTIAGGDNHDTLYGGGGDDTLDGGAGTDFADGGPGSFDRCLNVESSVNCEYFV